MAEISLTFLPFLKRQPPLPPIVDGPSGHLTARLDLQIIDNNNNNNEPPVVTHVLTMRGPGDVLGISRNMIARIEPPPRTHDFEPNYFPYIEFVDPDFPWRYSLDTVATSSRKVHPWLSLIVLSAEEIDQMKNDNIEVISLLEDRRQFLSVLGKYLPKLEDAWATAHVHLSGLNQSVAAFIESHPDRHCSRLFCFRRLAAESNYTAFLVPNYKIAVQAAFGLGTEGTGSDKAWLNPGDNDIIKLPIYFAWSFSTSEIGDFEYLARNLKPSSIDAKKVGTRVVDANLVKSSAEVDLNCYFLREGALAAPGYSANPENKKALFIIDSMLNSLNESLESSKESANNNIEDDEDPLITLPVYGRFFRKTGEVKMPENNEWSAPSPWIHELNLHFRNRVAAAFGTTVVQKHQDEYMRKCWAQVDEIRQANEQRRRYQAGFLMAKALENKHIKPLSNERFVLFSSPFHAHFSLEKQGEAVSLKNALDDSGISPGLISSTFRRIAHRQVGIKKVNPTHAFEQAKSGSQAQPFQMKSQPRSTRIPRFAGNLLNRFPASDLVVSAPKQEVIVVEPIETSDDFRAKFDIKQVLQDKLNAVIALKKNHTLKIPENFDPIMAYPRINDPMYKGLIELSKDYFFPGIENLENNGVMLCEENHRFIEAYLVGLNHEMGRELVWRRYPTDQRGTIFSYFWDAVAADNPRPDIKEIHRWVNNLASNKNEVKHANLILIIKGDLIRRYPGTIVFALKNTPKGNYWSEEHSNNNPLDEGDHKIDAIFRAQVGEDILCVGFPFSSQQIQGSTRNGEYYFILQENQDLPRFGLDVAGSKRIKEAPGCQHQPIDVNELSWSDVTLDKAGYITDFRSPFGNDPPKPTSSATIASKTYQQPIQVAIHASELLPEVDMSPFYQTFTGPTILAK
jgi:hypothetical protein